MISPSLKASWVIKIFINEWLKPLWSVDELSYMKSRAFAGHSTQENSNQNKLTKRAKWSPDRAKAKAHMIPEDAAIRVNVLCSCNYASVSDFTSPFLICKIRSFSWIKPDYLTVWGDPCGHSTELETHIEDLLCISIMAQVKQNLLLGAMPCSMKRQFQ